MTSLQEAEKIMGQNFIGPEQVNVLLQTIGLDKIDVDTCSIIPYEKKLLQEVAKSHILVYGSSKVTILDLREHFGIEPEKKEPCFYNQDWYLAESFMHDRLEDKWYLIKKDVIEYTRAIQPQDILSQGIEFPSAVLCTYTFFIYDLVYGEKLWYHDFIWCKDVDHNGDRIYVGKYHDIDEINKNGFSIHRHLSLRNCYASIETR